MVAKNDPPKSAPPKKGAVDPTPTGNVHGAGTAPVTGQQADAGPEFRWPARGRIIQGFKAGGNDGINISVPEGTSVRAAESGVVAYAGNELKGYGNLVLIRHPNGFVTAYANNGELDVKRGDVVKRGQVIAKSGETGNVSAATALRTARKGSRRSIRPLTSPASDRRCTKVQPRCLDTASLMGLPRDTIESVTTHR